MKSQWWELRITGQPDLEELIAWRLEKFGCQGLATEPQASGLVLIRAYTSQETTEELDLAALATWLQQDAIAAEFKPPQVKWTTISEEDWASAWKDHWQPQEIGDRFLIYPAWLQVPETDRLVLRLDPGAAFGTGTHPTTQLCLESLEMRGGQNCTQMAVADVGCGSGILAMGAIRLGFGHVYAVDTDPLAIKVATENRTLNRIAPEQLILAQGSIDQIPELSGGQGDGLVCNILTEVIVGMIPRMTDLVKPKGWAILSGIILEQAKDVADVLENHGWIVATLWKRSEWCCFNVRRG
jgi:ribosomal protein L11 methyltransferase